MSNPPVRLAIVGTGVMGANHARVAMRTPGVDLVGVVDIDEQKRSSLAGANNTKHAASIGELMKQTGVDAVVVASPTKFHHELAVECLDAGLHVLVEKPIASTVEEAHDMSARAKKTGVVLTVGHIERFNPAVRELLVQSQAPIHIQLDRVGPFTPRVSDNVVIDLMIHDLDLARMLARSEVSSVQAIHQSPHTTGPDMSIALLTFENGVTASVTASRISQQRLRRIFITEKDSVMAGDLIRQDVMIHRMQHVEYVSDGGARIRQSGMVEMPFIENRNEPLAEELKAFVGAIQNGTPTVTADDGIAALHLVDWVLRGQRPQSATNEAV
jgi:UDP-N-acetylglucosamine 3-dehydrogenase